MARSRKEEVAGKRRQRLKWGDPKLRMSVDGDTVERLKKEGKIPRWVNEDGKGRIEKLQQRGYEFVADESIKVGEDGDGNTDMGSRVSRVVGTHKNGEPMRAFLMVQVDEFYEEDQSEKENVNKMVDDAIRQGKPAGPQQVNSDDGQGNRTYVKSETKYQP